MLCSPERSRSAVDGRAEGCSVRERSVALAWTRTLLVVLAHIVHVPARPAGAHVGITGRPAGCTIVVGETCVGEMPLYTPLQQWVGPTAPRRVGAICARAAYKT